MIKSVHCPLRRERAVPLLSSSLLGGLIDEKWELERRERDNALCSPFAPMGKSQMGPLSLQ